LFDWIGQKLGNYQVVRTLGHGGFADVYLGQHIYLQTYAAIKVLQTRLANNDLQTFLQEARTVASLTHPHIVRVLEFGEEGHVPYLIMDYCSDGTLRQRHPKGTRVSLPECVGYIRQIAEALQYAHEQKIIHRDVKPENILIGQNDVLLLSDFGIATISQSSRYQGNQDIGGTISYAAPEQLQGKATLASDQYALGIMLYEWLIGKLPYQGSFPEIASQHLIAPIPSLREHMPELPSTIEHILQKALAKDPQQRFGSVQDFANALEQAAANTSTGATTILCPDPQENIPTCVTPPSVSPTLAVTSLPLQQNTTESTLPMLEATPRPLQLDTSPIYARAQKTANITFTSNIGFDYPHKQPKKKNITGKILAIVAAVVLLSLLICCIGARALPDFLRSANSGNLTNTGSSTVTSNTSSNTQSKQKTAAVPVPVGAGTINKNLRLSCTCDDPVTLTIKTITVDPKGNMTWNLSLTNVSGQNDSCQLRDFHLESAINGQSQTYKATGAMTNGYTSIATGQTIQTFAIFSFIPLKNTQYTLSSQAYCMFSAGTINFDSVTLTFS
jgi:serine/threonine protein kinase